MKKKRFYYAVVSFMRKDKENTKVMFPMTCKVDNEDGDVELKHFPVYQLIKDTADYHNEICIPQTILVENVFEISEEDYNNIREFDNSVGLKETSYYNGKKQ